MIKVNIYYGGRGLIEDPANYVMNKLIQVLEELNIQVKKYMRIYVEFLYCPKHLKTQMP